MFQFNITRPELLAQLEERRVAAGHHDFQDTLELMLTESSAWNALPRDAGEIRAELDLSEREHSPPKPKPRPAARPAKSRSHARKR